MIPVERFRYSENCKLFIFKNTFTALPKLPYISFKNVSFAFGSENILTDLTFNARRGKHTVLKGESGSGKSTIMKIILGFFLPDSGSISLEDSEWDPQSIRRLTAWLPQDLNLGAGLVKEIMAKPFEFTANRSAHHSDQLQQDTLQQLGLGQIILNKQFRDLSTGQRQRVGLAICHLLDKPLLLLDEPTSALDAVSKQKAADLLLNGDRTIISTSHDPFWVDHADTIIELD